MSFMEQNDEYRFLICELRILLFTRFFLHLIKHFIFTDLFFTSYLMRTSKILKITPLFQQWLWC